MSDLLAELKTEPLEEPDDEHTQVSIGNEHYAVTAQVSGLIASDNIALLEGVEPTQRKRTFETSQTKT